MKKIIKKIKEVWRSIFVGAKKLDDLIESVGTDTEEGSVESEFENEYYKFIWGLKSAIYITDGEPSLYTQNDIEILYNKSTRKYCIDIETAYWFDGKMGEIEYLCKLLCAFTEYMKSQGHSVDEPYIFWMSQPTSDMSASSMPELYTNFKIFVHGFQSLYATGKEE